MLFFSSFSPFLQNQSWVFFRPILNEVCKQAIYWSVMVILHQLYSSRLLPAVELISRKLLRLADEHYVNWLPSSFINLFTHTHTQSPTLTQAFTLPHPNPAQNTPYPWSSNSLDRRIAPSSHLAHKCLTAHTSHLPHNLNPLHSGTTWHSFPLSSFSIFFLHLEFGFCSFIDGTHNSIFEVISFSFTIFSEAT